MIINSFLITFLDYILKNEDESFKSINQFGNFVVEVLLRRFLIETCVINREFLENRLEEITDGGYYISFTTIFHYIFHYHSYHQ